MATWGPTEVAHTDDDCMYLDAGTVDIDGQDNDGAVLGLRGGNTWHLAYRFQNVTIPQAATIDDAILVVDVGWEGVGAGEAITAKIYGLAHDNVPDFNETGDGTSPDEHSKTTANVNWNVPDTIAAGGLTSPDIKDCIQEIVDRGSWASGNALAVVWYVSSVTGDEAVNIQVEDVSTAGAGEIATLEIDYTAGTGANSMHYLMQLRKKFQERKKYWRLNPAGIWLPA